MFTLYKYNDNNGTTVELLICNNVILYKLFYLLSWKKNSFKDLDFRTNDQLFDLKEVVVGDFEVLDALGRKISGLVKLNGHRGQAVSFQAQEALTRFGGV
jgi:hypothetical protein